MKPVQISYQDLKNKVTSYLFDDSDLDLVENAYDFAANLHYGQKRLTGDDYIDHPLNVAYILTDIQADAVTLAAGLLHDTLEDCSIEKVELETRFGTDVANIVDSVTKLNRLNFTGENEATIANHRKILVGLSEDVRVIFVKLADRLHNMRTLWVLPERSQKKKAKETLDILTPIAHRLGMSKWKSELEDLSLRYSKSDIYFSIVEQLNQTKTEREAFVKQMMDSVTELLNSHKITHEIKGRAKSIYSIYKKLDKGKKFSDIYDLLALRIFVDTESTCYQALGAIHSKYKPIPKRFKDYIAMPKTNMYQSLHTTVFGEGGNLFEIQIRTYEMDQIAERGIACHWSYKEKGSGVKASMQNAMEQKLQFFRSLIELKEEDLNPEEFVNSVKEDIFQNTIYVFTPMGDVIELPRGSTPIDFAYKVHSDVGNKMVGAIVNGSIVPLEYQLNDNDIVKIKTSANSSGPSKEWLSIVKTTQAKNKIRGFFHKIDKSSYLQIGQDLLSRELRKRKIASNQFFIEENINRILKEYKCANMEEVYISIGSNKLTVSQIIHVIIHETASKEDIILQKAQKQTVILPSAKNDILVSGIDDIKTNIAACCKPIPQDRIVGYITKGSGITVHRMVCPNLADLEERTIDVKWNDQISKKYPTTILVHALEDKNVLLSIIAKTSNTDIGVQQIHTTQKGSQFLLEITILVNAKEQLMKFMNEIRSIPNILDVERCIL